MGVHKPDPAFYTRALDYMHANAADVAYVGDRLDNDVRPSAAAGLRPVYLRRGPWGVIGGGDIPAGNAGRRLVDGARRAHRRVVALKLTVVGCAPSYTMRPGRSSSCYLVEHGSTRVVLDLGAGSFAETFRYSSFGDIAAVFVSHNHADHNVDLIPLRHWVKYANRGYGPALYSPAELRARFGEFQADADFLADLDGEPLAPRTFCCRRLTDRGAARNAHP